MIHQVRERSAFTVMQRIHIDGEDAVSGDIDEITFAVYPQAGGNAVTTGTLVVGDVMFDALQTGGMWDVDDDGYNFLHELDHTTLTAQGTYYVEYHVVAGATEFYCPRISIKASDIYSA